MTLIIIFSVARHVGTLSSTLDFKRLNDLVDFHGVFMDPHVEQVQQALG